MHYTKSKGSLGFRVLTSFNQAFVAKQGWKLLQFLNSLVAKLLQARYYKQSNFLNDKAGSNPSFTWRSILWGRQILQKGIGNGENLQVNRDNWIPKPGTFKPISSLSLFMDAIIAKMIDWIPSKIYGKYI